MLLLSALLFSRLLPLGMLDARPGVTVAAGPQPAAGEGSPGSSGSRLRKPVGAVATRSWRIKPWAALGTRPRKYRMPSAMPRCVLHVDRLARTMEGAGEGASPRRLLRVPAGEAAQLWPGDRQPPTRVWGDGFQLTQSRPPGLRAVVCVGGVAALWGPGPGWREACRGRGQWGWCSAPVGQGRGSGWREEVE